MSATGTKTFVTARRSHIGGVNDQACASMAVEPGPCPIVIDQDPASEIDKEREMNHRLGEQAECDRPPAKSEHRR